MVQKDLRVIKVLEEKLVIKVILVKLDLLVLKDLQELKDLQVNHYIKLLLKTDLLELLVNF